jgi:phosphotransferase system enzyme I (PtsI)
MLSMFGTAIGGGIVIGRACVVDPGLIDLPRHRIDPASVAAEFERLGAATAEVARELADVARHLPPDAPTEAQALLDVHSMILEDPALIAAAREMIAGELINAEWAVAEKSEELAGQFSAIEDPYLRERGRDVEQVTQRLLKALAGSRLAIARPEPVESLIFVANDFSPAEMLQLREALGFVIDKGGSNSHTAILARSMNVATVVGIPLASRLIEDGDTLILDGEAGVVVVDPDEATLHEYGDRQQLALIEAQKLRRLINVPCTTLDGHPIALMANIESPTEAAEAMRVGAAGIGLFRSEFLFLNRGDLPGEDEQYEAYAQAVRLMQGRPVTVRTLDVGADKSPTNLVFTNEGTTVSALGQRAIRFCLTEPDIFLTQLRAMLRASVHGPLRILLPMLSHLREVDQSLVLIERAREQLRARGVPFADPVPIGGMIEVPAAALTAERFIERLDFLSIGTNDLIQYTLAIDRSDDRVAHLYDQFHPAVLQLIARTIRVGRRAAKPVAVCGEMAGEVEACAFLLGAGLTEFSMHPSSLLRIKREILGADVSRLAPKVKRVLAQSDPVRSRIALERLVDGRGDGRTEGRGDGRAEGRGDGRADPGRGDGRPDAKESGLAEHGA